MVVEKVVKVRNRQGIHVRPAMKLSEIASRFKSDITVKKSNVTVNAKSILDILTLAATEGTELLLRADGEDAHDALEAIGSIIEHDFYDETMRFKDEEL